MQGSRTTTVLWAYICYFARNSIYFFLGRILHIIVLTVELPSAL